MNTIFDILRRPMVTEKIELSVNWPASVQFRSGE